MLYRVEMGDLAQIDLLNYVDYLERFTFSKDKADGEVKNILTETMKLGLFPYMYQKLYKDYHSFSVKN